MDEAQRLQYLDAMGIQPWISKEQAAMLAVQATATETRQLAVQALPGSDTATGLPIEDLFFEIGPGAGQTLLLCGKRNEASSLLASDIARCMDEAPVWGWQVQHTAQAKSGETGLSLERAIKERLFTRVLVFASGSAAKPHSNEVLGSARVIYAPPLAVLAKSPEQKRSLWLQLRGNDGAARPN